jgi:hypothetical protein
VAVSELRPGWVEQAANRRGVVEIPPVQGYDAVAVELLLLAPDIADVLDASFTVGRIARGGEAGSALVVAHSMSLAEPVRVRLPPRSARLCRECETQAEMDQRQGS